MRRADLQPRDVTPSAASRLAWARLDAPWLAQLAQARTAGRFDPALVARSYPEPWESESARLAGLIEAVGVLLPGVDGDGDDEVDGDGDEGLAGMLRARRIEYVDQLLATRRTRGTVGDDEKIWIITEADRSGDDHPAARGLLTDGTTITDG